MREVFFTGATGGLGEVCVRALAARATVGAQTSGLDALVNFAGVTAFGSLVEGAAIAQVERALAINVLGTVRTNAVFFDLVEAGGGRIVNCSSSAGWMTAQPFAGAYTLSKRVIEGYNDSLRRELLYLGIPVIKLQPGSFRTAITDDIEAGFSRALAETTRYRGLLTRMKPLMDGTLRRSAEPEALARVVVRALEAKRPRRRYRRGGNWQLSLLEWLPESWIDAIYRRMYGKREA